MSGIMRLDPWTPGFLAVVCPLAADTTVTPEGDVGAIHSCVMFACAYMHMLKCMVSLGHSMVGSGACCCTAYS